MSTISQRTPPASAASIRRASSPTVVASSVPAHVELVDHVVEPLLADGERSRPDDGT